MFFFLLLLPLLFSSAAFATTAQEYWTAYEHQAILLQKDPCNKASFETMGLSFGFKTAKNFFGKNFPEIKHIALIKPEKQTESYSIPIILIKGTWGGDDNFCRADNTFFKGWVQFAKDIANRKKARVELITFSWKASNQNIDRKNAGMQLAAFINTHYNNTSKHPLLYVIGHSHGGSVANATTHFIKREISDLINLATPVRHGPCYKPSKYQRFYQFYVEGDAIQWLGAGGRVKAKHLSPRRYMPTELHIHKKFHCIYTKIDGAESDHYNIKLLGYKLADILERINHMDKKQTSLVVNMVYNTKLYRSQKRKQLAKDHPILLAPYLPKKHFMWHQIDPSPEQTATQTKLFNNLYRGKTLTGRSRITAIVNNTILLLSSVIKNTTSLLRKACNPKLDRIPGSYN